ncbi:MAG: hypothetical protein ACLGHL_06900, partial [Actinomycetota bacterium]
ERVTLGSIPVTGSARTILDLAGVLDADSTEAALEDALRRGHVSLKRLRLELERKTARGVSGSARLRELLAQRPDGYR